MQSDNGPDFGAEIPPRAVSLVPSDGAMDEFPVLKAFQQYIDAEQDKARKRLVFISAMFGVFLLIVVSIFVILLINVTQRNQVLNDRLVDYAMKERDRPAGSAVVVQQPAQVDNSALLALTAQLEEMRKNFEAEKNARAEAEKAKEMAAKRPSAQDLEIQRLKSQLQIERDKVAAEREKVAAEKAKVAEERAKQKEIELEAYRRKHYPDLYQPVPKAKSSKSKTDDMDTLIEDLDDDSASTISYFDDDDEQDLPPVKKTQTKRTIKSVKSPARAAGSYKIPVETAEPQPEPASRWRIPNL